MARRAVVGDLTVRLATPAPRRHPRRQGRRRGGVTMGPMSRRSLLARGGAAAALLGLPGTAAAHRRGGPSRGRGGGPVVIGHRGASAYRPEHTLGVLRAGDRDGRRLHRARPRLRRRTGSSSPATRTTSAGRPTSRRAGSPTAGRARRSTASSTRHVVHRGLHARGAQDAAGGRAAPRGAPRQHGVQRAVRDPHVPGGHRPRQAPRGRHLPRDEAPDATSTRSACRSRSRCSPRSAATGSTGAARRSSSSRSRRRT